MIIKSSLGLSFGVVFSVLLFKRRAWPAWVGLGFGAGRAWEEADGTCLFIPSRLGFAHGGEYVAHNAYCYSCSLSKVVPFILKAFKLTVLIPSMS